LSGHRRQLLSAVSAGALNSGSGHAMYELPSARVLVIDEAAVLVNGREHEEQGGFVRITFEMSGLYLWAITSYHWLDAFIKAAEFPFCTCAGSLDTVRLRLPSLGG
jgi:hypothetical protein